MSNSITRRLFRTPIGMAATVMFLLALSWWWWFRQSDERSALFADPESSALAMEQAMIDEFLTLHERGDLTAEIQQLESYLAAHPRRTDAWFQLGLSYLETGQDERAISIMEEIRVNDPVYYPDATWYLGLSLLKTNRHTEARQVMQELADGPDAFYRAKASIVLERFL